MDKIAAKATAMRPGTVVAREGLKLNVPRRDDRSMVDERTDALWAP
jgi:hypothetical protein